MKNESFYPNKLMIATIISLLALFTPVFGLIPAIIAKRMVNELPEDYCPIDSKRASNISTAAIVIAALEIFVCFVVLIVEIAIL